MTEVVTKLWAPEAVKNRKRHYETVFILSPTIDAAEVNTIKAKVQSTLEGSGAIVLRFDEWGKKRMAHVIEKHQVGHYFYLRFIGTGETVRAVERILKLEANVLRYLSVCLSLVLSQDEIQRLQEKAPREPSSAPSIRGDEDDAVFDSQVAG